MNFEEYQTESKKTAIYDVGKKLEYLILGICGESGELAEKYKKIIRDKNGIMSDEDREAFKKNWAMCYGIYRNYRQYLISLWKM